MVFGKEPETFDPKFEFNNSITEITAEYKYLCRIVGLLDKRRSHLVVSD